MNTNIFLSKIQNWVDSQTDQTSAYEYEKSFDEMWQQLGTQVLQQSLGALPQNKNKKNFNE